MRARIRRVSRGADADMGDDIAALDEQFAVERDADRAACALRTLSGSSGQPSTLRIFAILPAGMITISSPTVRLPGLDASGNDSAIVEFVDRLHREPQRQFVERSRRVQRIEWLRPRSGRCTSSILAVRSATPSPSRAEIGMTAVGMTPRPVRCAEISSPIAPEAFRAEIDAVHLVDDDSDLLDAEQMQQIAVPPRLVAHAFQRVDDQHRAVGLCRAGDHVAQEFGVARRVDQHDVARPRAEADLRGVDGDALIALGLQRVQQERPFERHAAPGADRFQHFKFAVGQAAGLVQQPPDQRRLAVIDVADDDDADLGARRAVGRRRAAFDARLGTMHIHGSARFDSDQR